MSALNYEVIQAWVYNPSNGIFKAKKTDRAVLNILHCSAKDDCAMFKKGHCIQHSMVNCEYGKRTRESGFTPRAKGFYSWIAKKEKAYEGISNELSKPPKQVAIIGDYVWLPYSHMGWWIKDDVFTAAVEPYSASNNLLHRKHFTPENIVRILGVNPRGLFGGYLTEYQRKVIPKFASDLKQNMPDLFKDIADIYPQIESMVQVSSYIGRKALLSSLKSGTTVRKETSRNTEDWIWDGTYLTSNECRPLFSIVAYTECETKLKPKAGVSITIHSNDQVDSDTIFTD